MSERVDFSANAKIYDRRHGAVVADDGLDRLWSAAALSSGVRVLDVGAGTGRVAIPLAGRGCTVGAVEPARGMLDQLRAKDGDGKVLKVAGEGSHLPFPVEGFDVVVIARLLYLTPDWEEILREGYRVLAVGGRLLHEWGNGQVEEEWVQMPREFGGPCIEKCCIRRSARSPDHAPPQRKCSFDLAISPSRDAGRRNSWRSWFF